MGEPFASDRDAAGRGIVAVSAFVPSRKSGALVFPDRVGRGFGRPRKSEAARLVHLFSVAGAAASSSASILASEASSAAYSASSMAAYAKSMAKAASSSACSALLSARSTSWPARLSSMSERIFSTCSCHDRSDIEERRAGHDVDRAEGAEHAEEGAALAIDFAYAAVEEAEYAALDASLARMEADELAAASATP